MPTKQKLILTKSFLENEYLVKQKTPNIIANELGFNHKTVRAYIKKYNISERTPSEYNSLSHKTYTEPTEELLSTPLSIILHTIYKCEGWTSQTMDSLCFVNQDVALIKTFCLGIKEIYKYEPVISIAILYNDKCEQSVEKVKIYKDLLSEIKSSKIVLYLSPEKKNPLIKVVAGGNRLSQLFLKNANDLIYKDYQW